MLNMEFPSTQKILFVLKLADCGYSSADKDKIVKDFNLSEKEAEEICKQLRAYEPGIERDY